MAKVRGPLYSFDAHGKMEQMVFMGNGTVRKHFIPTNPRTPGQQNNRQNMKASGEMVKVTGATTRDLLKTNEILMAGKRKTRFWNAHLRNEIIGQSAVYLTQHKTIFAGFADPSQWETEGTTLGLVEILLENATDVAISPGMQLFALARTLYRLGIYMVNGDPIETNATAWATSISS